MNRQPALLHLSYVVQRQCHLLQITKIFDAFMIAYTADPYIILCIIVEGCLFLIILITKQTDQIRLFAALIFVCQLKQVGQ